MSKSKSPWLSPVRVVSVLVVLALLGWGIKTLFFKPAALPAVITAEVTQGDLEVSVLASGVINAATDVKVGAQASGQIKKLHVALGDEVKAGQLVAEIDSTTQHNALRNAEAQVALLQAQLTARKASLRQVELTFKRTKELLAEDAASKAEYESAEAALATARAEIAVLDAQIVQARSSLDTARTNLGYTRIVAPIDGVVIAVLAEEGRTVNAMQTAPTIIKLAKLDTVQIKAQISEADVVRVKPGLPVYFTILGEPNKRFEATLKSIEPVPESEQTDTAASTSTSATSTAAIYYNGLFEVPNPQGQLRVGMTAQVFVVQDKRENAVLMPSSALSSRPKQGKSTVRVLEGEGKDATISEREVRVGLNNRVQVEVLEGLKPGERVVVGDASGAGAAQGGGRRGPRLF